jgi:tripartite-type tricarboxylate transporter receptor subunit TctC
MEQLPDVPTFIESGYKDFDADIWFGVVAPATTPKDTLSQFIGWFTAALQVPEVKAKFAALAACRTHEINGQILKQMESTSAFSATKFAFAGNLDSFVSLFG